MLHFLVCYVTYCKFFYNILYKCNKSLQIFLKADMICFEFVYSRVAEIPFGGFSMTSLLWISLSSI